MIEGVEAPVPVATARAVRVPDPAGHRCPAIADRVVPDPEVLVLKDRRDFREVFRSDRWEGPRAREATGRRHLRQRFISFERRPMFNGRSPETHPEGSR
jgi:hypothetical protein